MIVNENCLFIQFQLLVLWCFVLDQLSVCMLPFVTNLGIVVHYHEPECHATKWDSVFKVKVTVWAYGIKI